MTITHKQLLHGRVQHSLRAAFATSSPLTSLSCSNQNESLQIIDIHMYTYIYTYIYIWRPPYGDGSAGVLATTLWDPSKSPRAVSSLPSPLTFAKDLIRGMLSGQVRGLATCGRETLARFESPGYAALLSGQVRGMLPEAGLSYCRHFLFQDCVVVYSDKA